MRGWMVVLGLGLAACIDIDDLVLEGTTPGSCDDGADNDQDGYFDCDDQGCWGSPDCDDQADTDDTVDDTEDTVDDTGEPVDTDDTDVPDPTSWVGNLQAFSMRYRLDIDPIGLTDQLLASFNLPEMGASCSASFFGQGVAEFHDKGKVRFFGTWERVDENCPEFPSNANFPALEGMSFASAAAWVPDGGDAYHTFVFPSTLAKATSWVTHADPAMDSLTREPFENEQYWVRFTAPHTYDAEGLAFDYEETESIVFEALLPVTFVSTIEVRFSEDDTPPDLDPFPLEP